LDALQIPWTGPEIGPGTPGAPDVTARHDAVLVPQVLDEVTQIFPENAPDGKLIVADVPAPGLTVAPGIVVDQL
jgi:hypothetical protein